MEKFVCLVQGHQNRLDQPDPSNQVALITDKPVHTTQNPEFFSEYEVDT